MSTPPKLKWPKYVVVLLGLGVVFYSLWMWREVVRVQRFRRDPLIDRDMIPAPPPPPPPVRTNA